MQDDKAAIQTTDWPIRITGKGAWVVDRMKKIDPGAFTDMRSILEVPRSIVERRARAFEQALVDWDIRHA